MKALQTFITDTPDPVFILNRDDRRVMMTNQEAAVDKVGEVFEEIIFVEDRLSEEPYVYYDKRWFCVDDQPFIWKKRPFLRVVLKKFPSEPGGELLHAVDDISTLLLHRLRSPLTGMQGYLQMREEELKKGSTGKLVKVWNKGFTHVFDVLDQLEQLHEISQLPHEPELFPISPLKVVQDVLKTYSGKERKRFQVRGKTDKKIACHPWYLRRALDHLLRNALEHSPAQSTVVVDVTPKRTITITNQGEPIAEGMAKKLFYPFVTDKAQKLGIGLTKALLYTQQFGGTVLLTANSLEEGIAFTLLFPPK